jgi:hypothetical protein
MADLALDLATKTPVMALLVEITRVNSRRGLRTVV